MSFVDDVLDSWRVTHERGECAEREARDGTRCPFCESTATGVSVTDLLEG